MLGLGQLKGAVLSGGGGVRVRSRQMCANRKTIGGAVLLPFRSDGGRQEQ